MGVGPRSRRWPSNRRTVQSSEGASCYLRVQSWQALPRLETVDVAGELLFVDIAGPSTSGWEDDLADRLRYVSETAIRNRSHVLIRAPQSSEHTTEVNIDAIAETLQRRTGLVPPIGLLRCIPGDVPSPIDWPTEQQPDVPDDVLLASARATELAALIKSGLAHWRPKTFHYELPSEEHRSDFIRLGDAFRSPRDAVALATWLYPYIESGRAVIIDSSSMLPLVLALQAAADSAGITLGPVVIRDSYPHSPLVDEELVELTAGANGALTLISVSSTGRTEESLSRCLEAKVPGEWVLESLVNRSLGAVSSWPEPTQGRHGPWLHVPGSQSFDKHKCALCADRKRSPRVRIDASSFANTSLPEPPEIAMPDPPSAARDISKLLEMYDDVDGIGIDCMPAERTRLKRSRGRWGVRFYPQLLLKHPRFIHALNAQLRADRGGANDGRVDLDKIYGPDADEVDAIVVLSEDVDCEGFDRLANWASEHFARKPLAPTLLAAESSPDDQDRLQAALDDKRHILVLTVGTVTGGTLQEMLIRIHRALCERPENSYAVSGLVVHARPSTFREWRSVRSAYNGRLVAMWITYLPSEDHPLAAEQRLVQQNLDEERLSESAASFVQSRSQQVLFSQQSDWPRRVQVWGQESDESNPAAVLLCGSPRRNRDDLPRLLPNSRFGHRMSMVGTLVGVGAVLHRRRLELEGEGGPPGLRFDLTRIPIVYFEVPILCAVLRWIRPFEAFWEYPGRPVRDVLLEMWRKAEFEEPGSQETLLAELSLAAASGKLPRDAKETLFELFSRLPDSESEHEIDWAPLEVARQLVESAWGVSEEAEPTECEESSAS